MSEEKSKGISLRRKKTTRPTISAPRQIAVDRPRDPSVDTIGRNPSIITTQTDASTATSLSATGRSSRPSISGDANKTSDLVKRRYSTRFTGQAALPDFGAGGSGVPAMPSLPVQYANQQIGNNGRKGSQDVRGPSPHDARRDGSAMGGRLKVDARALRDPHLQAEKYVQSQLAEATEEEIRAFQAELQDAKARTGAELQYSVYQNRTQFIRISKEADKLKSEMRALRSLMADMTGALSLTTTTSGGLADGGASSLNGSAGNQHLSVVERKRANRSSVANLEAMWSTHLQTLWKRVEGSQKYLPALPGRHILMESQRWVELNAATWKPRRRVALCLLNDHLLVASEKKRADLLGGGQHLGHTTTTTSSSTTFVAERCWPLQDVSLADISASSAASSVGPNVSGRQHRAMANAINVRAGAESFTYATNDAAEKATILVAFRKAQEDLRKLVAAEHGERERQLDELASLTGRGGRSGTKKAAADEDAEKELSVGSLLGLGRSNSILIDVDGRQQSLRWVESQIDALDIDIALQRFDEAVARTEKLRLLARSIKGNPGVQEVVMAQVDARASKLGTALARQLAQTSAGLERTRRNVAWLLRLGFEDMARRVYLTARTETLRLRTRALPFTGALPPYLRALAYTTFTLVLHTFRTFGQAFPASSSGSVVVAWAREKVEEFNEALARQMVGVVEPVGGEEWTECLKMVKGQAEVLKEVGVDFTGLVAKDLEQRINKGGSIGENLEKAPAVGLGVSGA
ncbi:hypothetical protein M433DRAFT_151334 [Acidomyces richmondensis BFW]|nr:MAG: hypothetical protein FE78DRAFT_92126 [Acidomyces sp. 'richmondensis']KYG48205.1 hypothetical protein M433DRAFT_151334 [Acidomyces richmondensis BFW]